MHLFLVEWRRNIWRTWKGKFFFKKLHKDNLKFVKITDEAINLAKRNIDENVVGKTSFDDCAHIALAKIHKVDTLIIWKFKDLVNVYRIRG